MPFDRAMGTLFWAPVASLCADRVIFEDFCDPFLLEVDRLGSTIGTFVAVVKEAVPAKDVAVLACSYPFVVSRNLITNHAGQGLFHRFWVVWYDGVWCLAEDPFDRCWW